MQAIHKPISSEKLLKGFELLNERHFESAELMFQEGLSEAEKNKDKVLMALFYSAFGVLYKLRKDFRKSWKYYEKAEKLLPDDISLKIISSRLLVDYFGQHDLVEKKMNKVLDLCGDFVPFKYQAYTILGLSALRKGDKKSAAESLKLSMECLVPGIDSIANIDFELVEGLLRKNIHRDLCLEFLTRARDLAGTFKEDVMKKFIQKLIDKLPQT